MPFLKLLAQIFLSLFMSEKFVKDFIIFLMKKLVEKTDNKVDDELVQKIEEAFYPKN